MIVRIAIIYLLLCFTGCGFKPMFGKENSNNQLLEQIKLGQIEGKDALRLKRIISESIPEDSSVLPLYELNLKIDHELSEQGILKNDQTTRYRIKITIHFQLIDLDTKKQVNKGSLYLYSSYDVAYSEFMNYISERTVSDKILQELCNDLKIRLNLILTSKNVNPK